MLAQHRLLSLDFLRGVAILLVLLAHARGRAFFAVPKVSWDGMLPAAQTAGEWVLVAFRTIPFGSLGVSLFFVVSGFCIHYGYLFNKNFSWKVFFARRFFRIYPLYLFAIILFVFLGSLLNWSTGISVRDVVLHLLFLQNITVGPDISPAFWTLAIEFQLYMMYPILILLRNKYGMLRALGIVSIPQFLLYGWFGFGDLFPHLPKLSYGALHALPFSFWFNWALGAYLAERFVLNKKLFPNYFLTGAVGVMFVSFFIRPLLPFHYLFTVVCGAAIVEYLLYKEKVGTYQYDSILPRMIVGTGLISYSLFALHQPLMGHTVQRIIFVYDITSPIVLFAIALTLYIPIIFLSYLSYRYIEKAGIAFGKKYVGKSHLKPGDR